MRKLTYLAFTLILAFTAAEIYARGAYRQSYLTGFTAADPVFHHIVPPYYKGDMHSEGDFDVSFTTNNRGMRGPRDYSYDKKPDVFRIAVFGDSFAFGVGVRAEETASAVLEGLLNRPGGRSYEVYNFGVNSYSPIPEYIYIKKELTKYNPDLVMLMLDVCDIQDDYLYEPHIVRGPGGDIGACDPFRINGRPDAGAILIRNSRLFFIIDQKFLQSLRKIAAIGPINYISNKFKGVRNKTEILTNRDIDNIYFDRFLLVREGKNKEVVMRHWQRTAKYLSMIKETLDRRGIKFALVTYPYGHQVGENQWVKGRVYWGFEPGKVYNDRTGFSIIEDFARERRIDFINLYDSLAARKNERLYFNNDGHWTGRGQEVAAEAIYGSQVFKRNLR